MNLLFIYLSDYYSVKSNIGTGSKPGEEDTAAKKIVTYDPVSDVYDIVVKYQTTYHYIYLP